RHELSGQAVIVRCDRLTEYGQRGIALRAVVEVPQHLIEGAILLHDIDHMLDTVAQEPHDLPVVLAFGTVEVVLGYRLGQALELVRLGHWGAHQRRALELELILVRGPGRRRGRGVATWILRLSEPGRGAGEMARVRPGAALAVDDVQPAPIGAEGDVMRFVG